MCALCGIFGGERHWTTGEGNAADARARQATVANLVLARVGLTCAEEGGRFVVRGARGERRVVHLGALWPAVDRLLGRPLDPLDPELIAALERCDG